MSNRKGYVLVVVLLILAVTTAVVIDFGRSVYGYVNTANNFSESERLSLLLKSAYILSTEQTYDLSSKFSFNHRRQMTFEEKMEDTAIGLLLEDNNSKFNLNSLVFKNGVLNETGYNIFRRLLGGLSINEEYADRLVDFIDPDNIPRVPNGESSAKNHPLFSLSELGYTFPDDVLQTVRPYLTVFGDGKININTADELLLQALHPGITKALAERLMEIRKDRPFQRLGDVVKVPGMEKIGIEISDIITVKSSSFNVLIKAQSNDLVETAEAGFDLSEGRIVTKYWKER
jgi:general secretion pathway protein K